MEQVLIKYVKTELLSKSKYKMINFDDYTNENKIEHSSKWPYIPDNPYRTLTAGVQDQEKLMHY